MLAGLLFGLVAEVLSFGVGYACLAARGIDYLLSGGQASLLVLGTVAGCALWGGIGVALGAIVRNQVGAVIGLLAWGFLVENIPFGLVPSVGRFGPVHGADSLIGLATDHLLPAVLGGVVLLAWAALLAPAGTALVMRRDVD